MQKFTSIFVIVLLLSCSVALCNESNASSGPLRFRPSPTIGFQLHSWNDLDEWFQGFHKVSPTWLKIDPQYVNGEICTTHGINDTRGCLLLNHDEIGDKRRYNTTEELLNLISVPWMKQYLSNSPIFIGLCFKWNGKGDACDSKDWLSLVDDFVENADTMIKSLNLSVEFILDGSAVPGLLTCHNLEQRWRPWVQTFQIPGDALEGAWSNDPTHGYDRLQVLDPNHDLFTGWKLLDYMKFKESKYPYLVWEPSDQQEILYISDTYLEPDSTGNQSLHAPGLKFAINIDPVQFEVFSGSRSGKALNFGLQNVAGSHPHVALVSDESMSLVLVEFQEEITKKLYYDLLLLSDPIGILHWISRAEFPLSASTNGSRNLEGVNSMTTIANESKLNMLATDSFGFSVVYSFDLKSCLNTGQCLTPELDLQLEKSMIPTVTSIAEVNNDGNMIVIQASQSSSCSALLSLWEISATGGSILSSFCVGNLSGEIIEFSVSVTEVGSSQSCTGSDNAVILMTSLMSENDDHNTPHVHGTIVCLDVNSRQWVTEGNWPGKPLLLGTTPSIATGVSESNQPFVATLFGEGFCYNSETGNKQADASTCHQIASVVPGLLGYSIGTLDELDFQLETGEILTSCVANGVSYGSFNRGFRPDAAVLKVSAQDGRKKIGVIAVHEGGGSGGSDGCGKSVHVEGDIVLDGWILDRMG